MAASTICRAFACSVESSGSPRPLGDRVRVVEGLGEEAAVGVGPRGLPGPVCADHDQECRRRPRCGHSPCDSGRRSVRLITPCGGCSTRYFRSSET